MIQVALLTEAQKNQLVGQLYTTDCYFYPIQDENNNWIISLEEINQCDNLDFQWVKNLTLIDYVKKVNKNPNLLF
jgi:hypothetical protein